MRRGHLEALAPVCPVCRLAGRPDSPLTLSRVAAEGGGHVVEGLLQCPSRECLREYPIIDGIPLIIADVRAYVSANIGAIDQRDDLGELTESVLGDCCGPGSAYVATREHLSNYAYDHYGDLDPAGTGDGPPPGAVRRVLQQALAACGALPSGPLLEAGCAVGRGCLDLAAHHDGLVVGVDMHFAMLRLAARVLREGRVRYPLRRVGLVFERREFEVDFTQAERVDFWACDATALPFPAGRFAAAVGLNLLDCVHSPQATLESMAQVLAPGAPAALCTPYDWSPGATPLEQWLGGHSQRSPGAGASEPVLRALLTPGAHPQTVAGLLLEQEMESLPWQVRTHDRAWMHYRTHLVVARRQA